jgi:hypothetical protein
MTLAVLEPRRYSPPAGWPADTFEAVTDAIAAALVAAVRRAEEKHHRVETREAGP